MEVEEHVVSAQTSLESLKLEQRQVKADTNEAKKEKDDLEQKLSSLGKDLEGQNAVRFFC